MGNVGTFITLLCNVLQAFVSPPCSFAPLPHLMIFLQLTGFFRLFRESVCPAFSVPLSAPACAVHADRCEPAQAGGSR